MAVGPAELGGETADPARTISAVSAGVTSSARITAPPLRLE